MDFSFFFCRSDAQRAAKLKENKEKELEHCAFNAEQIEDSNHAQSLVRNNVGEYFVKPILIEVKPFCCYKSKANQTPVGNGMGFSQQWHVAWIEALNIMMRP